MRHFSDQELQDILDNSDTPYGVKVHITKLLNKPKPQRLVKPAPQHAPQPRKK